MAKITLNLGGQSVLAEQVNFAVLEDAWCSYRLEDGTTVKLKPVVAEIYKLPIKDPVTGLDQFMIKSSNIASVEPPAKKTSGN
jgi:hypothetical protein